MTIPPQNPAAHPPKKTALMLLDFHQLVVDMIQPQETQDRLCHDVQSLLKSARAKGSPVIHAMMGFEQEPLAKSKVRQTFESKYKPLLTSAPEKLVEWEGFTDNAAPASHEITEQHIIESVIICGVITSGAVLSTAREAADLGFTTTVVEEGCWDYAPETHDVVLHKVLPMTAWVVKMETALKLLAGKSEALEDTK